MTTHLKYNTNYKKQISIYKIVKIKQIMFLLLQESKRNKLELELIYVKKENLVSKSLHMY